MIIKLEGSVTAQKTDFSRKKIMSEVSWKVSNESEAYPIYNSLTIDGQYRLGTMVRVTIEVVE
jgi:hypothetical protein